MTGPAVVGETNNTNIRNQCVMAPQRSKEWRKKSAPPTKNASRQATFTKQRTATFSLFLHLGVVVPISLYSYSNDCQGPFSDTQLISFAYYSRMWMIHDEVVVGDSMMWCGISTVVDSTLLLLLFSVVTPGIGMNDALPWQESLNNFVVASLDGFCTTGKKQIHEGIIFTTHKISVMIGRNLLNFLRSRKPKRHMSASKSTAPCFESALNA